MRNSYLRFVKCFGDLYSYDCILQVRSCSFGINRFWFSSCSIEANLFSVGLVDHLVQTRSKTRWQFVNSRMNSNMNVCEGLLLGITTFPPKTIVKVSTEKSQSCQPKPAAVETVYSKRTRRECSIVFVCFHVIFHFQKLWRINPPNLRVTCGRKFCTKIKISFQKTTPKDENKI